MYTYAKQIVIQGAFSIFPCIDNNPLFHQNQDVRTPASRQAINSQSSQGSCTG